MSVLANKRKISSKEFENTMSTLYKFTFTRLQKVPKRRERWINKDIYKLMNCAFEQIIEVNSDEKFQIYSNDEIFEKISISIKCLLQLEIPIYTFWNIINMKPKTREGWVKIINKELDLLYDVIGTDLDDRNYFVSINWKKAHEMKFVKTMLELHKHIHSMISAAKKNMNDNTCDLAATFINKALWYVLRANEIYPESKEEYYERERFIKLARKELVAVQRPILLFYNSMNYGENVMGELMEKLDYESKLLIGVQKSDKRQFGHLTK